MAPSYSAMGTVGGFDFQPRTMSQAAVAAENQALASAKGRRIRCNRGGGSLSTAECVARFRAGQDDPASQPNCSRDLGCSAGRMRAANFKEDDVTKSNYGECIECGRTGNRDSANRCYLAKCKAARKPAADPLAMQESPILDDAEVAALGEAMGMDMGQGDTPDHIEDTRHMVAEDTPDHISHPGKMVEATPDHVVGVNKMVIDPHDSTEPFVLAGIEFEPFAKPRPTGTNRATIRATSIGISVRAEADLELRKYTYARVTSSRDGQALAIKMSTGPWPGANKIRRDNGSASIAAEPLLRDLKHLVGRYAPLEATGVTGWFVVRFDGAAS